MKGWEFEEKLLQALDEQDQFRAVEQAIARTDQLLEYADDLVVYRQTLERYGANPQFLELVNCDNWLNLPATESLTPGVVTAATEGLFTALKKIVLHIWHYWVMQVKLIYDAIRMLLSRKKAKSIMFIGVYRQLETLTRQFSVEGPEVLAKFDFGKFDIQLHPADPRILIVPPQAAENHFKVFKELLSVIEKGIVTAEHMRGKTYADKDEFMKAFQDVQNYFMELLSREKQGVNYKGKLTPVAIAYGTSWHGWTREHYMRFAKSYIDHKVEVTEYYNKLQRQLAKLLNDDADDAKRVAAELDSAKEEKEVYEKKVQTLKYQQLASKLLWGTLHTADKWDTEIDQAYYGMAMTLIETATALKSELRRKK